MSSRIFSSLDVSHLFRLSSSNFSAGKAPQNCFPSGNDHQPHRRIITSSRTSKNLTNFPLTRPLHAMITCFPVLLASDAMLTESAVTTMIWRETSLELDPYFRLLWIHGACACRGSVCNHSLRERTSIADDTGRSFQAILRSPATHP